MANTFKNAVASGVGTSSVDVYTAPSATTSTLIGMTVANTQTSGITVTVTLTDTSASQAVNMVKNATVPAGGSLVVIGGDQKVVLEATDKISVQSSASTSADVIVSVLEQS